jgi:hypothetical protein
VERRTYVSTSGPQAQITLFHEYTEAAVPTKSTTSRKVENSKSPVVYLGTVTASRGSEVSADTQDLLAIKEDGEIQCYDGDNLQEKWTSPPTALLRDITNPISDPIVEFASLTNAHSASQGILKGRQDVFALFPQEIAEDAFNPEILVLIIKSSQTQGRRTLHIVSLPRRTGSHLQGLKHSVESLLAADLPWKSESDATNNTSFNIHVSTGVLQALDCEVLTTFDLTNTLPKVQTQLKVPEAQSFLRLSSTSILVASEHSIAVYNPKYQSRLGTVDLDLMSNNDSLKRKRESLETENGVSSSSCKFASYFPKLGSAVAIIGNNLVTLQIEGQQDRNGKPRAAGLLMDSVRHSMKETIHVRPNIEKTFLAGDAEAFDKKIIKKLQGELTEDADVDMVNGTNSSDIVSDSILPKKSATRQPQRQDIDQQLVLYALSRIFTWSENDAGNFQLSISFYPPKTFIWLLNNKQMTVTNIESTLRASGASTMPIPAGQLVKTILELDPDMDLLLALLTNNYLDASELLHAVRKLMESLGLLGENPGTKQGLLTNGDDMELTNGDIDEQVEKMEEEAEEDLERAEYQLGSGSGVRGEALSVALSKLNKHPSHTVVHALQTTFTSQEVVCLIYLLRFELARGAWTTKYFDVDQSDIVDEDLEVQDNSITLISSLLSNCVDAVGAGGWLYGEARLVDGDPFEAEELIASLKLEVSAALEGIEEAVYLKGLTSQMILYGNAVQKGLPEESEIPQKKRKIKPITLPSVDKDLTTLPIGLKAEQQISLLKGTPGGNVYKRSMRDIGYLKSQKVGKYSRERIVI